MAKHKLNARKVATAPPGKYEDGEGLRLVVADSGTRKWVLRITVNGKRREMGLGSYPDIGLADAREKASEYRKQAKEGIDPIAARIVEATRIPTFTTCAARYIRTHRKGWRNKKHARQWVSTLKIYARPFIGNTPIDCITTEDVLAVLNPVWKTKPETARRIRGRLERIFGYATALKYRHDENPARWTHHLDQLLPKMERQVRVRHHPAMPYAEVASFMHLLTEAKGVASLALQFLILTASRTGEVLNARWSEVDLDAKIWTIPASRMKAGVEHRVPLSDGAVAVLREITRVPGTPYIFPGSKPNRPLSSMALLAGMRRIGYGVNGALGDYVPHGFRSTFKDWAREVSAFSWEVTEKALAHTIKDKTERAYARGDLLEKRRAMMQAWDKFCLLAMKNPQES